MEELRREGEGAKPSEKEVQRTPQTYRGRDVRYSTPENSVGPGRVRQSGPGTHLSSVWDL
jgi:hypothetical protein